MTSHYHDTVREHLDGDATDDQITELRDSGHTPEQAAAKLNDPPDAEQPIERPSPIAIAEANLAEAKRLRRDAEVEEAEQILADAVEADTQ